ncbi:CHAD domain-containing protein [Martelella alba]|uniref:CHAD domain-containing protein n=1 Tax=Martelella alba TaxID=2590451 RepID=A0ABY2SQK2_9HYPH|nr:CHAD domain-containing protein [Martelella alba]TKI07773.1 CHAD domain-containing protein [Martelella alba]
MEHTVESAARSPLPGPAIEAVRAEPLRLTEAMTVSQGFQAIVINCLLQIQANAEGVRHQDAECVHQMRVGLRRLRSAFSLFKEPLSPGDALQADLLWLTGVLGAARDWDILAGTVVAPAAIAAPEPAALEEIGVAARLRARLYYHAAADAVGSPRYERLTTALRLWIQHRRWRENVTPRQRARLKTPIPPFADAMLAERRQRLQHQAAVQTDATAHQRHRMRIAAKKLRYTTEFFGCLYRRKPLSAYLAALREMQETLGWLNDAATTDRLLGELRDQNPGLAESIGFVRGYLAAQAAQAKMTLPVQWQNLQTLALPARR